jgi:hypothetical protein
VKPIVAVLAAAVLAASVPACTKDKPALKEPVTAAPAAAPAAPVLTPPPAPEPQKPVKIEPAPVNNCRPLAGGTADGPVFIREAGVVAMRFTSTCTTADGRLGVAPDASWLAMGIPCTGGGGRLKTDDNYWSTKFATYIVSTDCAMEPASLETARVAGNKAMGLDDRAPLIAYNPLAVQFWEVPGLPDADVGFTVDLRSAQALQGSWPHIMKREPLPVKLYGRENAWTAGNSFFVVEGDLVLTAERVFRLVVRDVRALTADELQQVKSRCEALRPKRACEKVF